jgi:cephalosporin hydroxylase
VVEYLPAGSFLERPSAVGNNPKTALNEWLNIHFGFDAGKAPDNELLISQGGE